MSIKVSVHCSTFGKNDVVYYSLDNQGNLQFDGCDSNYCGSYDCVLCNEKTKKQADEILRKFLKYGSFIADYPLD